MKRRQIHIQKKNKYQKEQEKMFSQIKVIKPLLEKHKIISLGFNCFIKIFLNKMKIEQETQFFDWIGSSTWSIRLLLENHFDDLLQKENLPIVSCGTLLKDAVVAMSEGRVGSAIIIDENNKVIGLLSDGDLRRYMMRDDFNLLCKVEEICTKNPKYIKDKNMLASDVLNIIEDNKIQLLLVLNDNETLYGILHIHKLIEAGIK